MPHMSQIVAIIKDCKAKAASTLTEAQAKFGKSNLYTGLSRSYTPLNDEDTERLPHEATHVQIKVQSIVSEVKAQLVKLFDTVATGDYGNCHAKADIIVDGNVLLSGVPATYILFLEKQLAELLTFAKKIPVLDMSEKWAHDPSQDCYATESSETIRTRKIIKPLVLIAPTKEHPGQAQPMQEDIHAGRWKTIKFSSALPASEVNAIIGRIEKLLESVKFAREEANRTEVIQQHVGATLLHYIFG